MKASTKGWIVGMAFLVLLLIPPVYVLLPTIVSVQSLETPDGKHQIKLRRVDGIDRNYSVWVDGRSVYVSPDFAPRRDLPFREALVWDTTGNVVILEVARHRVAAYDLSAKKLLSDDELLSLEAVPDPPLAEYFFEGEWPGIGRQRK